MAKVSAYSMINVSATLDGLAVRGFWDGDDAVTVERGADIGSGLVGADGSSIFSQSADKSARITLRLQHTSPTHRQLLQKEKLQRAGQMRAFPFSFIDRDSGEGGTADQCFIMQAPTDQKGKNASVRAWVIWAGEYEPNVTNA